MKEKEKTFKEGLKEQQKQHNEYLDVIKQKIYNRGFMFEGKDVKGEIPFMEKLRMKQAIEEAMKDNDNEEEKDNNNKEEEDNNAQEENNDEEENYEEENNEEKEDKKEEEENINDNEEEDYNFDNNNNNINEGDNYSNTESLFDEVDEEYPNQEAYEPINYGNTAEEVFANLGLIINNEK